MDSKKSPKGRKRSSQKGGADEDTWDCSVCTFKNNAEAFKCSMCGTSKGTSTRKPRLNPDIVAFQQAAQALTPPPFGALPGTPGSSSSAFSGTKTPIPSSSKSPPLEDDEVEEEEEEEEEIPEEVAASPSTSASVSGAAPVAPTKPVKKEKPVKKNEGASKKTPNKARLKNVDRSSATYHSVTVDDFTVVITEFKPKAKKEKKDKSENSNNKNKDDKGPDKNGESGGNGGPNNKNNHDSESQSGNKDMKPKIEPGDTGNSGGNNTGTGNPSGGSSAALMHNGITSSFTNVKMEVNSRGS